MNKYIKKILCIILTVSFAFSLVSCSNGKADKGVIKSLFTDTSKVSFSYDYTQLKDKKRNKTKSWRDGMVSGNGLQGFIESGSPYSDTFIFQNMHFIMPNENQRTCPVTFDELETVKQSIVKGEDITDNSSYDDVYRYHPGGQLRINIAQSRAENYIRYTDYNTSQVGVTYNDKNAPGCVPRLPQWLTALLLPSLINPQTVQNLILPLVTTTFQRLQISATAMKKI